MYHKSISRSIRYYNVNIVIKILILSDFLIWSANQLLAPIFAIFIIDKINGSIEVVGIASAIYLITKSIFEIPVGTYIDSSKTEKDDLYTALAGTVLTALVYFAYMYISSVWHIYLLQALMGLGAALAFPGWYSIFTKHVDKGREAYEWSLYDVLLGVGMAATAALGGFLAEKFGFSVLFALIGSFTLLGALFLIIGTGELVGKPLIAMFTNQPVVLTTVNRSSGDFTKLCLQSDIIISGVGKRDLITKDMVTEKSIVIDVGTSVENGKSSGDVSIEAIKKVAIATPTPGGIGPITVANLILNTIKCAQTKLLIRSPK